MTVRLTHRTHVSPITDGGQWTHRSECDDCGTVLRLHASEFNAQMCAELHAETRIHPWVAIQVGLAVCAWAGRTWELGRPAELLARQQQSSTHPNSITLLEEFEPYGGDVHDARCALYSEGHTEWADAASFDEELVAHLRDTYDVYLEPWNGSVLGIYPIDHTPWPTHSEEAGS